MGLLSLSADLELTHFLDMDTSRRFGLTPPGYCPAIV